MPDIWRTRDRLGREVVLTTDGQVHVLSRHDDMVNRLDEVQEAVERPDRVTGDPKYLHRENLYRRASNGRGWIKVAVHVRPVPPQGTWVGEIITAYPVRRPKTKEEPLPQ